MTSVAHLDWAPREREAFGRILLAMSSVRDSEERLDTARSVLRKQLADDLGGAPSLVSVLYWEYEIGISILAAAMGMTQAQVRSLIGTEVVETTCPCGDVFNVYCQRREHVKFASSGRVFCLACAPDGGYGWPDRAPGRRDLARVAELRAMDYAEYLQTPEWLATREQALARAHHCCEVCSGKWGLNVHHRTYDRLGSEQPRDLLVLCKDCHSLFHRYGRLKR